MLLLRVLVMKPNIHVCAVARLTSVVFSPTTEWDMATIKVMAHVHIRMVVGADRGFSRRL